MSNIIDRRNKQNKDKNLSNRKRFLDKIKDQVKDSVKENVSKGKIKDLTNGQTIKVKGKGTKEPTFGQDWDSGTTETVLPGNRHFDKGDKVGKPQKGGGGARGDKASDSDNGEEDNFSFVLTKEEFLSILFEDMELPDLVKKNLKQTETFENQRRGYSVDGNPSILIINSFFENKR